MAATDELSGRIVRTEKNFANIEVPERAGIARLDISTVRRILGSYIVDIHEILENDIQLKVRIVQMTEEILRKIPQKHIQDTVKKYCSWEVKFFRKDIDPAPLPAEFTTPEKYFEDSSSSDRVLQDPVGNIISALLQITYILNDISLSKLLHIVKSHFKVKRIPNIELYLMTEDDLAGYLHRFPQYFTVTSKMVKRCRGFTNDDFNAAITKKALEMCPASTARNSGRPTGLAAAAASSVGEPADLKDVQSRTKIIESVEECNRVLDPILDKAKSETVVIGLDCEGVKLGSEKGCLTLVQISTCEGTAFLFDARKDPRLLKKNSSLTKILEHDKILKVIHDCRSDTYSLHRGFHVTLKNVFDTSIAMRTLMEQLNRSQFYRISTKALCELLGEGVSHKDDEFVKKMVETPNFWKNRPFTEEMIYYAASDALCLVPSVYRKLNGMLTSLWRDPFTWSCKNTVEMIQNPPRRRSTQASRQGKRSPSDRRYVENHFWLDDYDYDDDYLFAS